MNYNVNPLVYHSVDRPTWMADGRFWYRDTGPDGVTFVLVDPAKRDEGAGVRSGEAGGGDDGGFDRWDEVCGGHHLAIQRVHAYRRRQDGDVDGGAAKMKCDLSGAGT